MLDTVEGIENIGQDALAEAPELVEEDLLAAFVDGEAEIEELLVVDPALFEGRGVLRPTQGQERAGLFPDLAHEIGRGGIAPGRLQRVDLQGQEIQARLGTRPAKQEGA